MRWRERSGGTLLALMLALVAFTLGCAESRAKAGSDRNSWVARAEREMSAAQRAAVKDGAVTEAEYEAGYQAYAACLRKAGYPLTELPKQGPFREMLIPDGAVHSGVDESCSYRHFWAIDDLYQAAHEAEQPGTIALAQCAKEHGIATPSGAGQAAIVAAMKARGVDALSECEEPVGGSSATPTAPHAGQ